MKNVRIKIYGRVQRIGFRFGAMQSAYRYGVRGIVQNEEDGTVYIEAEGEDACVDAFVQWCRTGPIGARVEKILIEEGEIRKYESFDINHV
jgi:acylphosphatase